MQQKKKYFQKRLMENIGYAEIEVEAQTTKIKTDYSASKSKGFETIFIVRQAPVKG